MNRLTAHIMVNLGRSAYGPAVSVPKAAVQRAMEPVTRVSANHLRLTYRF